MPDANANDGKHADAIGIIVSAFDCRDFVERMRSRPEVLRSLRGTMGGYPKHVRKSTLAVVLVGILDEDGADYSQDLDRLVFFLCDGLLEHTSSAELLELLSKISLEWFDDEAERKSMAAAIQSLKQMSYKLDLARPARGTFFDQFDDFTPAESRAVVTFLRAIEGWWDAQRCADEYKLALAAWLAKSQEPPPSGP